MPPPSDSRGPRRRSLIVVSVVASVALVAVLAAGIIAAARQVHRAVPDIAPELSLPPIATPPPVTDVQPLPSTLPTGSPVQRVPWTALNNGVVSVVPSSGGVDLTLLQLEQREWVPVPVPSVSSALRLDATVTATTDSGGNHIGLACQTPDHAYGATFAIDGNGEWFMSYDWPRGPDLLDHAQSGLLHDVSTANQLSAVCIEHSQRFEMLFAINGTVVADQLVPQMTTQPLLPMLYICSCTGHEATHDAAIGVSSIPYSG